MGSEFFIIKTENKNVDDAFVKLQQEERFIAQTTKHNDTIKNTFLTETITVSKRYNKEAIKKWQRMLNELLDTINEGECIALDLGVTQYHAYKLSNTSVQSPESKMCFVVSKNGKELKSFEMEFEAKQYAVAQNNPSVRVYNKPVLMNDSGRVIAKEEKIYKVKPKCRKEGFRIEEYHQYLFIGKTAE